MVVIYWSMPNGAAVIDDLTVFNAEGREAALRWWRKVTRNDVAASIWIVPGTLPLD